MARLCNVAAAAAAAAVRSDVAPIVADVRLSAENELRVGRAVVKFVADTRPVRAPRRRLHVDPLAPQTVHAVARVNLHTTFAIKEANFLQNERAAAEN